MSQKKAIHFGAGNIGRGFVAEFLHKSDYEVVFVDVVDSLISQLQQAPSYTVTHIGTNEKHVFTVNNYRAINSKTNESDVVEEIRTAQLVTCAVGPNILKFIAPVIAKGIDGRRDDEVPAAVIACENMIGATDTLRGLIEERTSKDRLETMSKRARYANAAIDRIVPNQLPDAGLNVMIESYCEWVVEKNPFTDHAHPIIHGVKWVDNLEPYIERKLFTVNTGHAAAAYYGYNQGKTTIAEALATPAIRELVQTILQETAALLIKKHAIDHLEQANYVQKIIERISNPYLEDTVIRVGRAPIRKVGRKERFIGPAAQLAERGLKFDGLLGAVEVALKFQNVEGDDESFKLSQILEKDNAYVATEVLTGLEPSHPLFSKVQGVVEKVQALKGQK